ncbi:MAG: TrmH family RNA methyltransferase [Sphaerochaetaceae bacterium]
MPQTYLIFGKESAGIQQAILSRYRSNCLRIPIRNEARSLNLANARGSWSV